MQKKTPQLIPVILSGGVGSRLWPLSRAENPKQFIRLPGGQSLIQKAFIRVALLPHVLRIITVCNRNFASKIAYEYRGTGKSRRLEIPLDFILEPVGRNTAAAIVTTALWARKHYGADVLLLVTPCDHLIKNQPYFAQAVQDACQLARAGRIVTFGVTPSRPETGYGYIAHEGTLVTRFIEKPSLEKAKALLQSKTCLWNAGIFCFTAESILEEFAQYQPDIRRLAQNALAHAQVSHINTDHKVVLQQTDFAKIPDESIDYAIMEKTQKASVVQADIAWDDVGNWQSFGQFLEKDENCNQIQGRSLLHDVENCIIRSDNRKRLISAVGVKDLVIVDTQDALLVTDKQHSQDVKQVYKTLKAQGDKLHTAFASTHHAWGSYTLLDDSSQHKVVRIEVFKDAEVGLKTDDLHSEHWTIVQGQAILNCDSKRSTLEAYQTVNIHGTHTYSFINKTQETLVLIMVQSMRCEHEQATYTDKIAERLACPDHV